MSTEDPLAFRIIDQTSGKEPEQRPWVHPLDTPEVKIFVKRTLPEDLATAVGKAVRPTLSLEPTEREREEASLMQQRRQKSSLFEPTDEWTARTMYEETFGVRGAATLGGILSHTFPEQGLNSSTITPASMEERFREIGIDVMTTDPEQMLADLAASDTDPRRIVEELGTLGTYSNASHRLESPRRLDRPATLLNDRPDLRQPIETGWMLMRASTLLGDQLTGEVKDPRLLQAFPSIAGQTKHNGLRSIWYNLSGQDSPVFRDDGTFRGSADAGFSDGLNKLAVVRSSPDYAILYRRFSALGAVQK